MCTAMALVAKNKNLVFGRTMDFSYELDPEVYVVPANYEWNNNLTNHIIHNKYKFIGTGQNIGEIAFADGVNENGLGVAALYFQGFAYFNTAYDTNSNKLPIAAYDIVKYLLGNCYNIEDIIQTVNNIDIIGVEDSITHSVAPLHWMVVDKSGKSITIEKTKKNLQISNNPLKVLANSPEFEWQMTNLRNYINLSSRQTQETFWENYLLLPFGQGAGTLGLPGDYTSPSRFVRVAFQKNFVQIPDAIDKTINLCFNIMNSVTIPKGIVITNHNTYDYTQYTVFMNTTTLNYYFNTYDNKRILMANINDGDSNDIVSLGKLKKESFFKHI